MGKGNEATTKFKADITELKKEFQEAQNIIRLTNAQFKNSSKDIENWAESADGVGAKIQSLNTIIEQENRKLQSLKSQYDVVCQAQGENSKGAQDLRVKIEYQSAKVKDLNNELSDWKEKQSKIIEKSEKSQTATSQLTAKIEEQKAELAKAKEKYTDLYLEQGKASDETRELKGKIEKLSSELHENEAKMKDAQLAADDLGEEMNDLEGSADTATGSFTILKGALADLLADGIKAVAEGIKDLATESESAYASYAAQTGTALEDMERYEEQMQKLFNSGMGEDMGDIAEAMAQVKQLTGEIDPSKLYSLTDGALTLRDTFDFDIQESMRAVKMLMDQFGVSGEEAFNLIVQGAQNGLNKNGDLLDTINEYGVHYSQLGYSANEFFNSLANGTAAGTFSVDKLGDAMKEFGIRTKDTATSTLEGFQLLGYGVTVSVEELQSRFAAGGETAKQAMSEVVDALYNMDDKVAQNQAGVDLFGTMWEDLGIEGIKALTDVNGNLTKTKDSLQDVKKIKYSDAKSELKALGRTATTEIFEPVVQRALPKIKKGIAWVSENLDDIIPIAKKVGIVLAAAFVTNKIANFTTSLQKIGTMASGLASPFGVATLAAGALTAAIGLAAASQAEWKDHLKDVREEAAKLSEEDQKLVDKINAANDSYKDWKDTKDTALASATKEYDYCDTLAGKLQTLVDHNGHIKDGQEEVVKGITDKLTAATGIKFEFKDGMIQHYEETMEKIDDVIIKQKALAIQNAMGDSYADAYLKKAEQAKNITAAEKSVEAQKKKVAEAEEKVEKARKEQRKQFDHVNGSWWDGDTWAAIGGFQDAKKATAEAEAALQGEQDELKKLEKALGDAEDKYKEYSTTIENYDGLEEAITSGDVNEVKKNLVYFQNNLISAAHGTKKTLTQQVQDAKALYGKAIADFNAGVEGATEEQVEQYRIFVNRANVELAKFNLNSVVNEHQKMKTMTYDELLQHRENTSQTLSELQTLYNNGAEGITLEMVTETEKMVTEINTKAAQMKTDAYNNASGAMDNYSAGIENGKDKVTTSAKNVVSAVNSIFYGNKQPAYESGTVITKELAQGIEDGEQDAIKSAKKVLYNTDGTMKSYSYRDSGLNVVYGFRDGIYDGINSGEATDAATMLGKVTKNALRRFLGINSPSRVAMEIGHFFVEGFNDGITNMSADTEKKIKNFAQSIVSNFQSEISGTDTEFFADLQQKAELAKTHLAPVSTMAGYSDSGNISYDRSTKIVFTQNNSSPKALSNAEIYRRTKNALALVSR